MMMKKILIISLIILIMISLGSLFFFFSNKNKEENKSINEILKEDGYSQSEVSLILKQGFLKIIMTMF